MPGHAGRRPLWSPEARKFLHERRVASLNAQLTGDQQAKELAGQILGYALHTGSLEKAMAKRKGETVLDRTLRLRREGSG